MRGLCGMPDVEDVGQIFAAANAPVVVLKYMAAHAVACHLSISVSALCYMYKPLHAMFCGAILTVAAWNGSKRYEKMLTLQYVKKGLEKRIEARHPTRQVTHATGKLDKAE